MNLGNFSVSLAVQDLQASKTFYQNLGFEVFGGEETQNWLILKNGDVTIGLFEKMFEMNLLTFNPGWDKDAQPVEDFTDIREIQRELKEKGVTFITEVKEDNTAGPASFIIADPDGNPVLLDQHV